MVSHRYIISYHIACLSFALISSSAVINSAPFALASATSKRSKTSPVQSIFKASSIISLNGKSDIFALIDLLIKGDVLKILSNSGDQLICIILSYGFPSFYGEPKPWDAHLQMPGQICKRHPQLPDCPKAKKTPLLLIFSHTLI